MTKSLILLSLIFLSHWSHELEASTKVVVNCRSDETGEKGDQDYPEKRAKEDSSGIAGNKESRGLKGEPGVCPSNCFDVEGKVLELEQNLQALVECVGSCIHGRCDKVNNTFVCLCETGYTGRFCKEFSASCDQPCGKNSQCTGWNQCTCDDGYQLIDDQCQGVFSNCNHVFQSGFTTSGIYYMNISGINKPVQVYCELNNNGGNWLVIQRRVNGNVSFDRDWADYKAGFGELNGDFWLGLDLMHALTSTGSYQLRVDLEDWNENTAYAVYSFSVGNSQSNYTLTVEGYSGTAGDSMYFNNNHPFTTKDRNNDGNRINCAITNRGGWWHDDGCTEANLNGQYYNSNVKNLTGIFWYEWRYTLGSMKQADMKIKLI